MREFTKAERRQMKEILKVGILRRHAEWQEELKALLDAPFAEDENEFDRSLQINLDKASPEGCGRGMVITYSSLSSGMASP